MADADADPGRPRPAARFDLDAALAACPRGELEALRTAGAELTECQRVLRKTSSNVVAEVLRHQGTFYQWNHYPKGDAIDWETHSQYYYHAHPKEERPGEHGHFHTFLRYQGMPPDADPAPLTHPQTPNENRIGAHLIALSMDKRGQAIKAFTTNRWVTDETWYAGADLARMVPLFRMDHTFPSWAANRWLTAAVALFRPQIRHLLTARDRVIAARAAADPDADIFEDRDLEVVSELDIDAETQIAAIDRALDGG
jgi:hypothetical protein